jgi:hypothetical protein
LQLVLLVSVLGLMLLPVQAHVLLALVQALPGGQPAAALL